MMSKMIDRFAKYLTAIEYPKQNTSWNIAGILKGKNAFYRFDVREIVRMPDGSPAKEGKLNTKAEKLVFERDDEWIIFDLEELNNHVKTNKLKKVYLDNLLKTLEWNIRIKKWD